jgi:hypothetical protein
MAHLPKEYRDRETWRYVATKLDEAARGASMIDLTVPLRRVCQWMASRAGGNEVNESDRPVGLV